MASGLKNNLIIFSNFVTTPEAGGCPYIQWLLSGSHTPVSPSRLQQNHPLLLQPFFYTGNWIFFFNCFTKVTMNISEIMKTSSLEIDDVRWYLSLMKARALAELKDNPIEMVNYIHSKQLESDLYDMEQRFIDDLQEQADARRIDEATVREVLYKINREKTRRREGRVVVDNEKKKDTV